MYYDSFQDHVLSTAGWLYIIRRYIYIYIYIYKLYAMCSLLLAYVYAIFSNTYLRLGRYGAPLGNHLLFRAGSEFQIQAGRQRHVGSVVVEVRAVPKGGPMNSI